MAWTTFSMSVVCECTCVSCCLRDCFAKTQGHVQSTRAIPVQTLMLSFLRTHLMCHLLHSARTVFAPVLHGYCNYYTSK